MEMKTICIYTTDSKPMGIKVILDHLQKESNTLKIDVVTRIEDAIRYDVVLPYGIQASFDLIQKDKSKCALSLVVDATSSINISMFHYFKGKKIISHKERLGALVRYFYHLYQEWRILKTFSHVMLVSYYDKHYYETCKLTKKYSDKIIVSQNGVEIPKQLKTPRGKSEKVVLGFIRSWESGVDRLVPSEIECFLEYVWKEVTKINPNVELKLYGFGMTDRQKEFLSKFKNVFPVGSVNDLNDYFDQIDINLMIMPKKGGLLNKLLDGFAYKCPSIAEPQNLWAFKNLPDCCYTYTDAESLVSVINEIRNNPKEAHNRVESAYLYVKEYHDWSKNYRPLVEIIQSLAM